MNKLFLLAGAILIITVVAIFYRCTPHDQTQWDDPLGYFKENIVDYHEASIGTPKKVKVGNQSVYIDFSMGINQAYSDSDTTNKIIIRYLTDYLVGNSIEWFSMGDSSFTGELGKIVYSDNNELYSKITDKNSYNGRYAPIEASIKKITNSKNDALLITDFEEYTKDRKEITRGFAKDYFISWLKNGNSISIYYKNYHAKADKLSGIKNLYYIFFNYGKIDEQSLLSKFKKSINGRESEIIGLNNFEIESNPFNISNNYGGQDKTGIIHEPDINDFSLGHKDAIISSYHNGNLSNNQNLFEVYDFDIDINSLYKVYFKQNKRIFRKIFLNASDTNIYKLQNISVSVTDVTDDYIKYVKCKEAKNSTPVLVNDEGNNKIWDASSKNNPIITECYIPNSTKLKNDYLYKYKEGKKILELFDLDANIFQNHLKNTPKTIELITKFHDNFNGYFVNNDPIILRVDFIIDQSNETINISELTRNFSWTSILNENRPYNESLSSSIINAIKTVKPNGIIYSYYLKLNKTGK